MTPKDDGRERGAGSEGHVAELLDAYRTGELNASRRAEVDAHLEVCERCRAELAALGSWAATIERGYAAIRSGAREVEPDWGAQRAAVVARTSGRRSAAREGWSFRRWAPQVAVVAVAALIVGVVWRERVREPGGGTDTTMTRSADEAGQETAAAPGGRADEDGSRFGRAEPLTAEDAPAPTTMPQVAPRAPQEARPTPEAAENVARERAVPPTADEERPVPEKVDALEKESDAEQDRAVSREGVDLRAAQPSLAAPLGATERFEREARTALAARDSAAARRALALWSDTLAAAGVDGERAALADSLERFLDTAE
ncbi:MAG TPA: zf-HC2 domain-containing protein [Gemmatimonadota bacterium]|nr:zf-HC2 domain-containing protein [Gemmatimonadota bacterium]